MAAGEEGTILPIGSGRFVLLALFDGIRGCSTSLRAHQLEPFADYSSEVENRCQQLIAAKFPNCVQLGDIKKIDRIALESMVAEHGTDKPWLVVGGSPCQDLSIRRGSNAKGLVGKKSKLFFEFVRIVNTVMGLGVQVVFILENVASMPDSERDTITASLGVEPLDIDSALVSACHRRRYYWTNLPTTQLERQPVDIDSFLDEGWQRVPPGKPFRCFVAQAAFQMSRGRGEINGVRREEDGVERSPNADERERILGFPRGHTRLNGDVGEELFEENLRLKLVGNSFSVQVVSHLLMAFAAWAKDGQPLTLLPLCCNARILTMNRPWQECANEGSDSDSPFLDPAAVDDESFYADASALW